MIMAKGFRRQDAHKKAKLPSSWRKPRGLQNKVRLKRRGYIRPVGDGHGAARATRGLVKGLRPVPVATAAALQALDPKAEGAVIASTLGGRKREALLAAAKERSVTVLNLDPEKALAAMKERLAGRKQERAARTATKEAKSLEEKAAKSAQKPGAEKKEESEEERKEAEEAAKRKVLTKKE